jgi:hypothetical protein
MSIPQDTLVENHERDGYMESHYLGTYSVARYIKQMDLSVGACIERNLKLLLVDIRGLQDYQPTTTERYQIGMHGASISRGLDKVAALGTPQQITPDQFASVVAQNRGLRIRGFTDPAQAVQWLLETV